MIVVATMSAISWQLRQVSLSPLHHTLITCELFRGSAGATYVFGY